MQKKVFQILFFLVFVFLGSTSNAPTMAAWGAQDWLDSNGTPAPNVIRRMADEYWRTCEAHGKARLLDGYGHVIMQRTYSCPCECCDCDPLEYKEPNGPLTWQKLGHGTRWGCYNDAEDAANQMKIDRLLGEANLLLRNFKAVVAENINGQAGYDDSSAFTKTAVEAGPFEKRGTAYYKTTYTVMQGGWFNPAHLAGDTMRFVNSHGGWRVVQGSSAAQYSGDSVSTTGYGTISGVTPQPQHMM